MKVLGIWIQGRVFKQTLRSWKPLGAYLLPRVHLSKEFIGFQLLQEVYQLMLNFGRTPKKFRLKGIIIQTNFRWGNDQQASFDGLEEYLVVTQFLNS